MNFFFTFWKAPLEIPPDDHKLQYVYCIWHSRKKPGNCFLFYSYAHRCKNCALCLILNLLPRRQTTTNPDFRSDSEAAVPLGTVERFWSCYCYLARPSQLPSQSDYHLFKEGIKPMWEVRPHFWSVTHAQKYYQLVTKCKDVKTQGGNENTNPSSGILDHVSMKAGSFWSFWKSNGRLCHLGTNWMSITWVL